jgi:hypothetical protein
MKSPKRFLISIGAVALFFAFALIPAKITKVHGAGAQEPKKEQDDQEPMPHALQNLRRGQSPEVRNEKTEGPDKDDPLSRMRAEFESRGRITAPSIQRHVREAKRQRDDYPARFSQGEGEPNVPSWKSLGPTSDEFIQNSVTLKEIDSGRLRTILPHPTDPDTVYVLGAGGGLWKTTNFRSPNHKWRPLTDSVGTTSGGSVAFGSNPNTLYLGTGDPFDAPGGFMVRSIDNGETWSDPFSLPDATRVLEVKVDPISPNRDVVLAGTDAGLFRCNVN